jgi:ribA/ribD-fused uncharacterized protein
MCTLERYNLPIVTDESILGFFGDYRFLSNFHLCDIDVDGIVYPSTEHAYMAMKSSDRNVRLQFSVDANTVLTPKEARALGQKIKIVSNWKDIKVHIMYIANKAKYTTHLQLKEQLLSTGDRYLEETNWWHDTFWGVDVRTKVGQNNLGKVLMQIRSELT